MANSILQDRHGPDWPLGNIVVTVPGTPVSIMSLVDPTGKNDPSTQTSATPPVTSDEYTIRAQQIIFQGFKAGAGPPKLINNTGNVYIVRKAPAGGGGVGDLGIVVGIIAPGGSIVLASGAQVGDVFSPYRYFIDADNANDACQVSLLIMGI